MLNLSHNQLPINTSVSISGSKSISNRLLIIKEVLGLDIELQNLSNAEDTELLKDALLQIKNKTSATLNIHHAGTDMRFLTALLSCKKGEWILTGSERMKQRPIGELVNALKQLGADIDYLKEEGFPPLKISGKNLEGGTIKIDGSISSQFISALLLISPNFKNGLELIITNQIVSMPYITMTVELLKQFGEDVKIQDSKIKVQNSKFKIQNLIFFIESDWSSASYWYSICALSNNAVIELKYLQENSLQADSILPKLFFDLGVNTEFKNDKIILSKKQITITEFNYDFTNCPDIAQTLAVTCFALGIKANFTGLQTLKVKETDRIVALKNELEKFGSMVHVIENSLIIKNKSLIFNLKSLIIHTYNDHRMAMAFAPLALKFPLIQIENPSVVTKSYPKFWDDLKNSGILFFLNYNYLYYYLAYKMKHYSTHAIDQFTRHTLNDTIGFNWLMNNGYKELIATLDAIRDDKNAFKFLMDNKHFVLAAFVNSIWEDEKAFKFLMDAKAYDWAACANIINGDDKAEEALNKSNKKHFVLLAHAIQSRIHEDGDRNVSPWGVMQNLLNFKKAAKKIMRVIDNIPHKSMTISIFQMNDKYQVKFEAGPMEQIFKFLVEDVKGLDGLKQKIDEAFIETTRIRFNDMYKQMM